MFHKKFGNNGGEGGTHGSSLSLLVANSIKTEEGGGQTNFDMFWGFKVKNFGNKVNGFRDRDFGENGNNIKANHCVVCMYLDVFGFLNEINKVHNEGGGVT